ncbi:MAG: N-acetyltransferase [Candidatus Abyssobacteria bacterium SURF_5]|jgi:UDP-2-acetamido-3-amino-2,3-dideoxy-glucuronate N-acetyltransferase|uniref:N-acetyltransferase n=1 Tax=Abyssobacteria bacterium (strain SURF_5) TaxID=2093360 RepID=A0A3A4NTW8_ABYX5|nr:MAG: N-acetyltransferase [Candidatus Abyssubacteria bacterium SURF_5]
MKSDKKNYFVHETAVVDAPADIGEGTKIWHFSHVMSGARIGKGCVIGQNVFVGATAEIGNNVKIQNNVSIYEGIILEDDVFCGPSCVFTNVIRPRSRYPRVDRTFDATIVRKGVTIGANATIVCGVYIGEYSFIGAGSVVTSDVPPYALVYGNPARHRGWVCECGGKLAGLNKAARRFTCGECGRKYRKSATGIVPNGGEPGGMTVLCPPMSES